MWYSQSWQGASGAAGVATTDAAIAGDVELAGSAAADAAGRPDSAARALESAGADADEDGGPACPEAACVANSIAIDGTAATPRRAMRRQRAPRGSGRLLMGESM